MSAQLLDHDVTPESTIAVADADQVDVRLDDLIVGRPLSFPIFDNAGTLLLAAHSTITTEFRKLLRQRGVTSVRMHAEDADKARLKLADTSNLGDSGTLRLDSAVTTQLDRVIDSGLLTFQNTGPKFREQVIHRGREAYDVERQSGIRAQRDATCASLTNMMKDAVHGHPVESTTVTSLASRCLSDMADDTDCVLSTAMEISQDPDLSQHCLKMATLGMAIGIEMGLDEDNCKRICLAGLVHDWGMAKVPAEIRNSPRKLSADEFFQIQKHPIHSVEMLERMKGIPSMIPVIAYQIHERPNGSGYPRGRSGERIHLFARILAVADRYAALTEQRPYRAPLAAYAAMECLIKLAKTRDVDPDVVRAFLRVMSLFPIGSFITLNDGSVAQVIRRNGDHYTKPMIRVIQDHTGNVVRIGGDETVIDLTESRLSVVQALPNPGRNEQLLSEDVLYPKRSRV